MQNTTITPLFLKCSRSQAATTWLGFWINFLLIAYCVYWLATHFPAIELASPWLIVAILVALFIADFISGLVHWATDTWFDEFMFERVVSIAREHHLYPHHIIGYGMRDYLGYSSWPSVILIGPILLALTLHRPVSNVTYLATFLCTVISVCMVFGTYAHRLGHVRTRSRVIHFLRRCNILISPSYHKVHHISTKRDVRYCVINGWANPICDRIGLWRALERLVQTLTGAVPRRNDDEWLMRFAEGPEFMHNPVPSLLALRRRDASEKDQLEAPLKS